MDNDHIDHLGETVEIIIDRPLGSKDKQKDFIYLANCGTARSQDAYLLGVYEPVEKYEGRLVGIIYRERNDEPESLVVAPKTYTADQITALTEFRERDNHSWVAYAYDRPYWPEEYSANTPEVQKALRIIADTGAFDPSKMQTVLQKGRGYIIKLEAWLKDNGLLKEKK